MNKTDQVKPYRTVRENLGRITVLQQVSHQRSLPTYRGLEQYIAKVRITFRKNWLVVFTILDYEINSRQIYANFNYIIPRTENNRTRFKALIIGLQITQFHKPNQSLWWMRRKSPKHGKTEATKKRKNCMRSSYLITLQIFHSPWRIFTHLVHLANPNCNGTLLRGLNNLKGQ